MKKTLLSVTLAGLLLSAPQTKTNFVTDFTSDAMDFAKNTTAKQAGAFAGLAILGYSLFDLYDTNPYDLETPYKFSFKGIKNEIVEKFKEGGYKGAYEVLAKHFGLIYREKWRGVVYKGSSLKSKDGKVMYLGKTVFPRGVLGTLDGYWRPATKAALIVSVFKSFVENGFEQKEEKDKFSSGIDKFLKTNPATLLLLLLTSNNSLGAQ